MDFQHSSRSIPVLSTDPDGLPVAYVVDIDKQGATATGVGARCQRIGMTFLSIIIVSYMSLYGIPTLTALAQDPTTFGVSRTLVLPVSGSIVLVLLSPLKTLL